MYKKNPFYRHQYKILLSRLKEKRQFIQVLTGPRQSGKTTIAQQVLGKLNYGVVSLSLRWVPIW